MSSAGNLISQDYTKATVSMAEANPEFVFGGSRVTLPHACLVLPIHAWYTTANRLLFNMCPSMRAPNAPVPP